MFLPQFFIKNLPIKLFKTISVKYFFFYKMFLLPLRVKGVVHFSVGDCKHHNQDPETLFFTTHNNFVRRSNSENWTISLLQLLGERPEENNADKKLVHNPHWHHLRNCMWANFQIFLNYVSHLNWSQPT